jgi:hypothetical protein
MSSEKHTKKERADNEAQSVKVTSEESNCIRQFKEFCAGRRFLRLHNRKKRMPTVKYTAEDSE